MIECVRFKSFEKGCLQGFATLYIDKWGVEIHNCTLNMKNGGRWVSFPAKEHVENGEKKFIPVLHFRDKSHKEKFSEMAVKAIEKFCAAQKETENKDFAEEAQRLDNDEVFF